MDLYGHNPFSFRTPNLANPPLPDGEVDFSDLGRLSQLVNRKLAPPHHVLCLTGEDDKDSLSRMLSGPSIDVVILKGAHHFDGGYEKLAQVILDHLQ